MDAAKHPYAAHEGAGAQAPVSLIGDLNGILVSGFSEVYPWQICYLPLTLSYLPSTLYPSLSLMTFKSTDQSIKTKQKCHCEEQEADAKSVPSHLVIEFSLAPPVGRG